MPVKGWEAMNKWNGILHPHELANVVNPESNMIVSANNGVFDMLENDESNISTSDFRSPLNVHMRPYRRDRTLTLLKTQRSGKKHTQESMQLIQTDTAAPERLREALMRLVEQSGELQRQLDKKSFSAQLLKEWNGHYAPDSLSAIVFDWIYRSLLDEIYGGIVFGREIWSYLQSNTEVFNIFSEFFGDFRPSHIFLGQ